MNVDVTLSIITVLIMLVSFIAASLKSGSILGSIWSQQEKVQPKLKINSDKVGKFIIAVGLTLAACGLLAIILTRDLTLIVQFALFNTLVLCYPLSYWILFKEVPRSK